LMLGADGDARIDLRLSSLPDLLNDARTVLAEDRSRGISYTRNGTLIRVFLEIIAPPPHLLVVGAGHDAVPVARLASEGGWDVTVADPRSAYADAARFPQAIRVIVARPGEVGRFVRLDRRVAAVLMTHNVNADPAA